MSLDIDDIRPADHEQWRELFTMYRAGYDTTAAEDDRVLATTWSWLMDESNPVRALVAREGSGLAGFGLAGFAHYRVHGRPSDARTVVHLEDLFTSPERRGRGVARALIGAIGQICAVEGHALVRWTTEASNTSALGLYNQLAEQSSRITFDMTP